MLTWLQTVIVEAYMFLILFNLQAASPVSGQRLDITRSSPACTMPGIFPDKHLSSS